MKYDFKTKITVNFLRIYIDVFLRSQQIVCNVKQTISTQATRETLRQNNK